MALVMILVLVLGFVTIPFSPKHKGRVNKLRLDSSGHGGECMRLHYCRYGSPAMGIRINGSFSGYRFQHPSDDFSPRTGEALLWMGHANRRPLFPCLCLLRTSPPARLLRSHRLEGGERDWLYVRAHGHFRSRHVERWCRSSSSS